MTKRTITSAIFLLSIMILGLSCGPNKRILESANASADENSATSETPFVNTNAQPAGSSFEQDLNAMRTADFTFIVVFRRKDGQTFDAADKKLLAEQAVQANRRRISDEGKAIIIGSNFPFATGTFSSLAGRFVMENFSKPDSGPMFADAAANK